MTTTEDLLQNPIIKLLHGFFVNREESLQQLKDKRPDDDVIREYIGHTFGIMGGGSLPSSGWYEYTGGKNPHIEIQDKDFKTLQRLEGVALVQTFRLLYDLPKGQQLSLF